MAQNGTAKHGKVCNRSYVIYYMYFILLSSISGTESMGRRTVKIASVTVQSGRSQPSKKLVEGDSLY